jgi:hypothetical protein
VTLPPAPSSEDWALVRKHPKAGRCVVVAPRYRSEFADALAATGLFESVEFRYEDVVPDGVEWIVQELDVPWVDPYGFACPDEAQLLNLVTLGISPLVRERSGRYRIGIRRVPDPGWEDRYLHVGGPVTSVGGWIALPLLLMPWRWTLPESGWRTDREAELLAVEIVKRGILDAEPGTVR